MLANNGDAHGLDGVLLPFGDACLHLLEHQPCTLDLVGVSADRGDVSFDHLRDGDCIVHVRLADDWAIGCPTLASCNVHSVSMVTGLLLTGDVDGDDLP